MKELNEIRDFAFKAHSKTNHMYGGVYPYSLHLQAVADIAERYMHLLPDQSEEFKNKVRAACYLHDSIEDARLTYNDVKEATDSEEIAEAVFMLTNLRGRTRAERANAEYYKGVRENKIARFVKLCDRIANMEFGKQSGGSMLKKYRKELSHFLDETSAEGFFPEMAEYLRSI
jgi:(p)ppGpp synthase/HD superfamily hydrolase